MPFRSASGSLSEPALASLARIMSPSSSSLGLRAYRFCSVLRLALVVVGGCALDDRTLSSVDLEASGGSAGSAGEFGLRQCNSQGDSACETCLYANCCLEARACGPNSRCVDYLQCATACSGDATCLNACASDSPIGFGAAAALGVCSQTQCSVCSGADVAFEGCAPDGSGACENVGDCSALAQGAFEALNVASCEACAMNLLGPVCARCLSNNSGLSEPCSSCMASWVACAVGSCSYVCDINPDAPACGQCVADAGCKTQLASCGFTR